MSRKTNALDVENFITTGKPAGTLMKEIQLDSATALGVRADGDIEGGAGYVATGASPYILWVGDQTAYDAVVTKDPNTFYHVTV